MCLSTYRSFEASNLAAFFVRSGPGDPDAALRVSGHQSSPRGPNGRGASGSKRPSLQISLVKNPTGNSFELATDSIIRHAELFVASSSAKAGPQRSPQKKSAKQETACAHRFWPRS